MFVKFLNVEPVSVRNIETPMTPFHLCHVGGSCFFRCTVGSQISCYNLKEIVKMKNHYKFGLIVSLFSLCFLYYLAIMEITEYYWSESTFHYQMGALAYSYGDKIEGEKQGKLAQTFQQKGNETLKWLPSFARIKRME